MEQIRNIFLYNEDKPLDFSRLYFWIFFFILLTVYSILYKKKTLRNAYLFAASLFFYWKSGGYFFSLLIFSTIVDYTLGLAIYRAQIKWKKILFLCLSLFANLGVLAYFKYSYFLTGIVNDIFGTTFEVKNVMALWTNSLTGSSISFDKIILPVGISFYTFQTISYSVDVYRNKLKPVKNIIDFGFYVSFFPQLVAGPIVRAAQFIPQLYKDYKVTKADFNKAIFLIINGLIKKMIISNYISINFVDRVFENPLSHSGFENLMAIYGYAIQIYCDFSGYSDIAIGVALLLGFRLPLNFNSPYKAANITDFWRRWHISLSSWLKDYLYISIGGNRKATFGSYFFIGIFVALTIFFTIHGNPIIAYISGGVTIFVIILTVFYDVKVHTYINLMVTMLLGGLWHGAAVRFIIWGAIHGIALALHKLWMAFVPQYESKNKFLKHLLHFLGVLFTFHIVNYAWIYFRAPDMQHVNNMLYQIFNSFRFDLVGTIALHNYKIFLLMMVGIAIHWLPVSVKESYINIFNKSPIWVKVVVIVLCVVGIYQAQSAGLAPFIYFQF
jgi:alginate O-acetyltransferase complex protein AlgI